MNTIEKLNKFVNSRPGIDKRDYSSSSDYNRESREITQDRNDYLELLALASARIPNLDSELEAYLIANTGERLFLKDGKLVYHTGQYYPTEYRVAACRVLKSLIWNNYREEMVKGERDLFYPVYKDGHEIRKAIQRNLSNRTYKNYFN